MLPSMSEFQSSSVERSLPLSSLLMRDLAFLALSSDFLRNMYLADSMYSVYGKIPHGFITIGRSARAEGIMS